MPTIILIRNWLSMKSKKSSSVAPRTGVGGTAVATGNGVAGGRVVAAGTTAGALAYDSPNGLSIRKAQPPGSNLTALITVSVEILPMITLLLA